MDHKLFHIEGVIEFQPRIFEDERGYFTETFSMKWFEPFGEPPVFVQDNQSCSKKGVLRGLHFQKPPHAQGKLVRVTSGKALDVAVDLRKNSATYGQYVTSLLEADKHNLFYIPAGFAHGFVALEEDTIFLYKCTDFYAPATEGGLLWNDPAIGIDWGVADPLVSPKDEVLPLLKDFDSPF